MKQKLAIARALLHQPKLVFLDEPTAGMDPLAATELRDRLTDLSRRENVTIFLTTHNLYEAQNLCDLVGVLRKGKLVALGAPDELLGFEERQEIEVKGKGFDREKVLSLEKMPGILSAKLAENVLRIAFDKKLDIVSIINHIASPGLEITEVINMRNNLEDVFAQLMEE